ncbi:MAG: phosphonopyruvate decarboxylase [Alphaproteobacteria bacterium]|nr:phosphonopyruvate decarboxylase [Alphaproteobacteria bacterium]
MTEWQDDIHRILRDADIRQVCYVPDAGHSRLIELCEADPAISSTLLSTEEEGVAHLAGAWLGGQKGALLMQSSGVGNCINMLSLTKTCAFPLLMLITMRGEWGEFNPWQVPMGSTTQQHLELAGCKVYRCDAPGEVAETIGTGARFCWYTSSAVAVLLGQRLIGAKIFVEDGR